jgi:hypothetical protein
MSRDISTSIEQIDFVHCLVQELENLNIDLPMGDYRLIYDYLEGAREVLMEFEEELESQLD